ncbi:M50 family metallopeptidase [Kocuria oceani]|uniref:M50 family metallopeptidase n=1 Tax=Kocuria oceani TaxID=988827 RepID=A0ABV9TFU4_9MICC|nr:site-2 protease family protein [Kocuria oceani]
MGVVLFLVGVLLAAVAIAASIALHELGHLVPAKLFGVRVTQYMVGFGRTVFSRRRGETEYGLKAVPLGGYISMVGMYPPARSGSTARTAGTGVLQQLAAEARSASAVQLAPGDEDRVFYRLPVWKRIVIMLGGPVMNLLLGTVCLAVLLTGFGTATPTTTVAWVSECVVPAERQAAGQAECRAGDPEAPANAAGLRPGDVVTAVAGAPVTTWEELTARVRDRAGERIPVVVERDGTEVRTVLTPILTSRPVVDDTGAAVTGPDGAPRYEDVGFIGISPTAVPVRQPLTAVPGAVLDGLEQIAGIVLHLPQRVYEVGQAAFSDAPRDPDGPISVVGIGRISGEIAAHEEIELRDKAASLVGLVGSVNLALFVFNLLPLLPLDGGHVAGALWEGLRRGAARLLGRADPGPFDPARLLPLTYAVAALMIGMSVLLVYADIVKPVQLF